MPPTELLDFLERRAGEVLRGVAQYKRDETDILRLRKDIREERMESQVDRMIRRLRPESDPDEERAFPFGELHVTVRRFDEAIIIHFPMGNDRGLVVALEPEASRNLNMFTDECLRRIHA